MILFITMQNQIKTFTYIKQSTKLTNIFGILVDKRFMMSQINCYRRSATTYLTQSFGDDNNKNNRPQMGIGLLKVTDPELTIFLAGHQLHVTVLFINDNGRKIVWGYLTSENKKNDDSNHFLSKKQAFEDSVQKSVKEQRIKIFEVPFIVEDTDISPLKPEIQKHGETFINDKIITNTIKEIFTNKVISKLEKPLHVYEGIGITSKDIQDVLNLFEQDQQTNAKLFYTEYLALKKQFASDDKINKWLLNKEKTDPHAMKYLMLLINEK